MRILPVGRLALVAVVLQSSAACRDGGLPLTPRRQAAATGPLRPLASNPRYFTDGSGRAVYLTGSHTWSTLQDNGVSDPPPPFDYDAWLDTLVAHNHNFFRLWVWEQARWTSETAGDYWIVPLPWVRTGPGLAADGKPRFDLTRLDPRFFERLRERVAAAGRRGIYVAVMLFNGWSIEVKGRHTLNNPWQGHPFNATNNVNGIDGSLTDWPAGRASHALLLPRVLELQEAYVRHVVDAVNDLDNVLYEISNESDPASHAWQYHMIEFVKRYEAGKPKQHPVGMTVAWPGGSNGAVFASPADWVSPNDSGGYFSDPPPADGQKVIILDSDHLGTERTESVWVWKSFLRGLNPVFMDTYDGRAIGLGARPTFDPRRPQYVQVRRSLGYTLTYASRADLAAMRPAGELASSSYCLAGLSEDAPEYLVYLPRGGSVNVDLSAAAGRLAAEWFSPRRGRVFSADSVLAGGMHRFTAPFRGDALLYLHGTGPIGR